MSDFNEKRDNILSLLRNDLSSFHSGKATPSLLQNITVSVYGGAQKLKLVELGTINVLDNHALTFFPWDASIIGEIRQGIMAANLGLTPNIDGTMIRVAVPPLSQERREELVKLLHQKLEAGRIMVRQARHEDLKEIEGAVTAEDEKERLEKELQENVDETMAIIENLGKAKEEELLTI